MDISGSSDDDSEVSIEDSAFAYFSPFLSASRLTLDLNKHECERIKHQIMSDLRIGSVFDIGEKHSLAPSSSNLDSTNRNSFSNSNLPEKYLIPKTQVHYPPTALIKAREQGDCGTSSRYHRLRYFFTSPYTENTVNDRYHRWPRNRSFQRHIQGNIWSVSSFGLDSVHLHHAGCVNALNFNQSGNLIASGSDDQRVAITDFYTGELKTRFHSGHTSNVFQVKFVPETGDLQLVTSARDGLVQLATLSPDGHSAPVSRILARHGEACHKITSIVNEPSIILTAGEDGCVYSIDLRESSTNKILHLPLSPFYTISSNPVRSSQFCVAGKYESVVRVFDRRRLLASSSIGGFLHSFSPAHLRSKSRNVRRRLERFENEVSDLDEGNELANDEDENDIRGEAEWGMLSSRLSQQIVAILQDARRNRLASPPPLEEIAPSSLYRRYLRRNRRIRYSARLNPLGDYTQTNFSITSAVYSNHGDAILASFNDEDIYLFDSQDDSLPPVHAYRGHRNNDTVKGVNFYGPDSEYIVSGSDDGFIYIWDRHSEGIVQWLCGDIHGAVNVLEPHPTLPIIATSGCDSDFKIWAPRPGRNGDYSQPESWLSVIKSKEVGRPPLFDPERVVSKMNYLRRCNLAKRIFGENDEDSHNHSQSEITTEVEINEASNRKRSWSVGDAAVDSQTSNSAKRSKEQSSVETASQSSAPAPIVAPQERLPFNANDLRLRVISNWAVRCYESRPSILLENSEYMLLPTLTSSESSNLQFSFSTPNGQSDNTHRPFARGETAAAADDGDGENRLRVPLRRARNQISSDDEWERTDPLTIHSSSSSSSSFSNTEPTSSSTVHDLETESVQLSSPSHEDDSNSQNI